MSQHNLPSLPHIAKSICPTVEGTVRQLQRLDASTPPFSYDLSWRLALPLYSGAIKLNAALEACHRLKPPLGAKCNAEVVEIMWQDSQGTSYFCHPLKDRFFPIRHDLLIPVRPRFYFVKNGVVNVFWLQPWKKFSLSEEQLGILASVIKQSFFFDDFENANLYLLDTSADSENERRKPQVFSLDNLPILSDEALKSAFDRFAMAYDIFLVNRKPKSPRVRPDTPHPDLFD